MSSGNFVGGGIEQRTCKEAVLSTTKEPAAPGGKHTELPLKTTQSRSSFMYIDIQKYAFSQHIVLAQHSVPKWGKAGFGWNPREGRMPVAAHTL